MYAIEKMVLGLRSWIARCSQLTAWDVELFNLRSAVLQTPSISKLQLRVCTALLSQPYRLLDPETFESHRSDLQSLTTADSDADQVLMTSIVVMITGRAKTLDLCACSCSCLFSCSSHD